MSQPDGQDDLLWRHLKTLPAFRALLRAVESRFYHAVDLPEPLLDLGCGDGDFARHTFNEYGRQLGTGIDPWWNPLQKTFRAGIYRRGVVQGWGDNLPFADGAFASAMSNSVLEHIPHIQPVLNEISRVLQPGGRFLITMPNHQYTECLGGAQLLEKWGLTGLAGRYRAGFNFIARHAHTEGIDWWASRLAEAGMAIQRWQYYFSPEALHVLEIGHAQGVPSWVTHALTGQWVLAPTRANLMPTERWVRPYFLEQAGSDGTMVMIVAQKAADHPIPVHVPEARPFEVDAHGRLVADDPVFGLPQPEFDKAPPQPVPSELPAAAPRPVEAFGRRVSPFAFSRTTFRQLGLGVAAVLLGWLTYGLVASPGNERPWLAVITWLTGILAAVTAVTPTLLEPARWISGVTIRLPGTRRSRLTAAVLFAIALAVRLIGLTTHPFILSGTEAALGNDAWRLASGVWANPFGTVSLSNPALPLYVQGLTLGIFGKTILGIRLLSALAGAATVAAVYALGRRLYAEAVGAAGAIILLGMHVHLHYSRLGLTNIWDPLLMTVGLGLMIAAWRRGSRLLWLLTGLVWGISNYFYTVGRLLPVVVLVVLALQLIFDRPGWYKNGRFFPGAAFVAGIIALPLLRHYRAVPGVFWERYNLYGVGPVGWMSQLAQQTGRPVNALWVDHIIASLTPFHGAVDRSLYYQPERGLTGIVIGLLVLIGLGLALRGIAQMRNLLLIVWVGLALYVGGVLMIESPASHRVLIATPAVALLAALPFGLLERGLARLRERWSLRPIVPLLLVGVLAAAAVFPDLAFYFGPYRDTGQFADSNTEVGHRIGDFLAPLPVGTTVYLLGAPRMFSDFPNITFLASQFIPRHSLIDLSSPSELPDGLDIDKTVWIVLPERQSELAEIQSRYPGGETTTISGRYAAPLFFVYSAQEN